MSPRKRLWVATAALVVVAAVAIVLILRWRRPLQGASAGAAPELVNQLPADAPVVAYIDVAALRRLQNSPLTGLLGLAGENPSEDRDYQNFVRDTGFDYRRDLDRVAIALWPSSSSAPNDAAGNRTVAVADGRFDQARIKAYALRTGKTVAVGGRAFYVVPGSPPVTIAFLSATRIALVSGPGTEEILVSPKASSRDAATEERIERVAGAPIFAVARTDKLPASFLDSLRNVPQFESLARNVEGLLLAGQPDGELIHVTLDAECDSMANAVELSTAVDSLRLLGSIALADPKTRRQMSKQQLALLNVALSQAKLSHQDRWVRLTLDVTPAMLGQLSAQAKD